MVRHGSKEGPSSGWGRIGERVVVVVDHTRRPYMLPTCEPVDRRDQKKKCRAVAVGSFRTKSFRVSIFFFHNDRTGLSKPRKSKIGSWKRLMRGVL